MADSDGGMTNAEAGSEQPPSSAWRLGSVAVAGGLAASTLIHLALFGTALFVSPRLLGPTPVSSMTVDIVTPEEVAEASKNAESPSPPKSEPDKPAQPAMSQLSPSQPPSPQPQALPSTQAPPSPPLDAFAMPRATPPQSAPALPGPSAGEAARLAQLLGLPTPTGGGATGGGPSEYKANLSPEEIAAFSTHVQSCWTAPASLATAPKLNVVIRVSLRPDGGLTASPVLLAAPASVHGPALVKAAMLALQQCQPYSALPPAKYDEWRLLDLHFSADGMSSVSPVPSEQRKSAQPG